MASPAIVFFTGFATAAAIGAGFAGAIMEADSTARQRQSWTYDARDPIGTRQAVSAMPSTSGRAGAFQTSTTTTGAPPAPNASERAAVTGDDSKASAQPEQKQKKNARKRLTKHWQTAPSYNNDGQFSFGREQGRGRGPSGLFDVLFGNHQGRQ